MEFYGTFGPACCDQVLLRQMITEGMTGIRMNLSHGNLLDHANWIEALRAAQKAAGKKIEFLIDLRGPELRIGKMKSTLALRAGEKLLLQRGEEYAVIGTREKNGRLSISPDEFRFFGEESVVPVPPALFRTLREGQRITANDGTVLLEVLEDSAQRAEETEESEEAESRDARQREEISGEAEQRKEVPGEAEQKEAEQKEAELRDAEAGDAEARVRRLAKDNGIRGKGVHCIVLRGGTLESGKSIGIIGEELQLPILSSEDILNLRMAREAGVTAVMQPFAGSAADVSFLRQELKAMGLSDLRIFAKIENRRGLKRLEEIMKVTDHIVIARGDLGSSIGLENVPAAQELIAARCRKAGKQFMVVTQLLHSMIGQSSPTRAEVGDIYHAVQQGAASLMLTGETAIGNYPLEAMRWLKRVAEAALETSWTEEQQE